MKDLKQKLLLFVNLGYSAYAGMVLATAFRLSYDPSTYIWFRLLCELQYRVTTAYLYCVAIYVFLLVYVGTTSAIPAVMKYLTFFAGTVVLICSEAVYGIWMCLSLKSWWTTSRQAEMVREVLDMEEDVKTILHFAANFFPLFQEIEAAIYEAESKVPKNVYVVVAALALCIGIQVLALVVSWLLRRRANLEDAMKTNCPVQQRPKKRVMFMREFK